MKGSSNIKPEVFLDLGNGKIHYNHNIVELDTGEGTAFSYDVLEIRDKSYEAIVSALIGEKYTLDAEIALINNYNRFMLGEKQERYRTEYEEYLAFTAGIKEMVAKDLK